MNPQVTEAHIALSARITRENGYDPESAWNRPHVLRDAQYIADSEAQAVQTAMLREYGNLSATNEALAKERDKLRAEVDALKQCIESGPRVLREDAERNAARAERAEAELAFQVARNSDLFTQRDEAVEAQEKAEAELATCRESLHLADGTANLALVHRDAAEAELATERARLRKIALAACKEAQIKPMVWYPNGSSIDPNSLGIINQLQVDVCVAAIDAAMKEGK